MAEPKPVHEVPDDVLDAIDYCYAQGWTDGLPVVPPEQSRVAAMLAMEGRPAETIIAAHPATGLELTVHAAAVNAVMAGCLPEYFPVVVAAFEAMQQEPFNFHGSTASTGGSAPLLIVSGPIVDEIGMNAGVNLFGPGNRANATIGRAVRLILLNVFRMVPGIADKSTQGNPGKYSFCIAERADVNPWPGLNEEAGLPREISTVTVFAGAGFCNVENHGGDTPEAILDCIADVASAWVKLLWYWHRSMCRSWPAQAGAKRRSRNTCSSAPSAPWPGCAVWVNTYPANIASKVATTFIVVCNPTTS